ncbi:MAG TPA: hypothetical protein VK701_06665 [Solirubrobacteraceae bacterium]|nr:hypothetical protein [Solirubrobacteraceae bacterium]
MRLGKVNLLGILMIREIGKPATGRVTGSKEEREIAVIHGRMSRRRRPRVERANGEGCVVHLEAVSSREHDRVSTDVRESVDPIHARDVLDEAVRHLAASAMPIVDRLSLAGEALKAGLTWRDLVDWEDRRLLERIFQDLGDLQDVDEAGVRKLGDAALEAIAADIVDLRDTLIGRAIRRAMPVGEADGAA